MYPIIPISVSFTSPQDARHELKQNKKAIL